MAPKRRQQHPPPTPRHWPPTTPTTTADDGTPTPPTMPRHQPLMTPTTPNNDATSPPPPIRRTPPTSSATIATSLLNGNSRRWGWWGRMDKGDGNGNGDRRRGEGEEEEGERRRALLFPGFFVDNGGGWRATMMGRRVVTCRPILTCLPPQQLGGIIDDGGGVLPTRRPPFNFIYPPSLGVFFLRH